LYSISSSVVHGVTRKREQTAPNSPVRKGVPGIVSACIHCLYISSSSLFFGNDIGGGCDRSLVSATQLAACNWRPQAKMTGPAVGGNRITLPSAHCFYTLKIVTFPSQSQAASNLLLIVNYSSSVRAGGSGQNVQVGIGRGLSRLQTGLRLAGNFPAYCSMMRFHKKQVLDNPKPVTTCFLVLGP